MTAPPASRGGERAGLAFAIASAVFLASVVLIAKTLLKTQDSISRLRGRVYDFQGAKLIPTFHPSYLLRSPQFKREAWEDLKKARALLTLSVSGDD